MRWVFLLIVFLAGMSVYAGISMRQHRTDALELCERERDTYRTALARECSPLVVDWDRLECDRRGLPALGATLEGSR